MSESSDANLQLKKRARRRLIGSVAFAGLAAVVLPMVMDEEPKQQIPDVQIRIPGQDASAFAPKQRPAAPIPAEAAPVQAAAPAADKAVAKPAEAKPEKLAETKPEKPVEKAPEKPQAKPVEKPADKAPPAASHDEQRAAAILSGKAAAAAPSSHGNGQQLILIGAFSNPGNVKQLQTKLGELGIKVFTEPLDSPEGKKTRVRAGPFPSREAAEKALEKMKRIGVNGVIAAKQ